jgi:hypothetical protein
MPVGHSLSRDRHSRCRRAPICRSDCVGGCHRSSGCSYGCGCVRVGPGVTLYGWSRGRSWSRRRCSSCAGIFPLALVGWSRCWCWRSIVSVSTGVFPLALPIVSFTTVVPAATPDSTINSLGVPRLGLLPCLTFCLDPHGSLRLCYLDHTFVDCTLDHWRRRVLDNINRAFLGDCRSDCFGRVDGFSGGSAVGNVCSDVAWDRGGGEDG